jgi:rare lipoprotein A
MNSRRKFFFFLFLLWPALSPSQDKEVLKKTGKASYYHDRFSGQETSSGEIYVSDDFTAAHRSLPFNTLVLVTNKKNRKSVVVRINDRGPFVRSRIIDLSRSAAMKIGMVPFGVIPVSLEVLTILDAVPDAGSLLKLNSTWDCYGKKLKPGRKTISVWTTEDWKHAFYMSSTLAIDYRLDRVGVRVGGIGNSKEYNVIITGIKSDAEVKKLLRKLKSHGFRGAAPLSESSDFEK